jgi:hypothetical protein
VRRLRGIGIVRRRRLWLDIRWTRNGNGNEGGGKEVVQEVYVGLVDSKVSGRGARSLYAYDRRCELWFEDAGVLRLLEVNATGWRIGVPIRTSCEGLWEVKRSAEDSLEL